MKRITKKLMAIGLLLSLCNAVSAQSDQYIGINSGAGLSPNSTQTYIGLSYENRFSNLLGVETGVYQHNFFTENYKFSYLTLPLSLKLYTKVVNISLGVEGGIFTGASIYASGDYTVAWDIPLYYSIFSKISHDFSLNKSFYIEPEIFINHNYVEDISLGLGVKIKYLL